ncbi:PepSY domain-containing protein [Pseudomethylobacillus aquaticus]|uniref:PepSY domain-containing protein n=1 Tax=Pseudomethylobacillus aquaticus TaxID=2676064 RepID=A0A3N0V8D7_9PROT|nr:PepSY-associated TM helix domain-containing protein [Pseudomethylobacillus aquaticus]ROH88618.1 PepSY domain-containing protein [Pseudomethylobacillus aquaticus]
MRNVFVILHRWLGLTTAVFLFVAGLTGAIISWDHELDEWLNPDLFHARSAASSTPQSAFALARQVEARDPRMLVTYLPLLHEPGHTTGMMVKPRIDPANGKAYTVDYNQVALDPVTAEEQGRRMWGEVSLSRENLLPFLYKLHYSLHIPDGFGIELGILIFGIVGILWVIDSFVALWISFPSFASWRKSFAFRWGQGSRKVTFDLHRSGGVWVWALLLIVAVTSVSMNLNFQVMRPIVSLFSELTPSPFLVRAPQAPDLPYQPGVSREQVVQLARAEASKRGWTDPAGAVFYSTEVGVYGVGFFQPGNDHGDGGLGNPWLYFDGPDGRYLGDNVPGTGTAGDIFMQAQFPLHSGRILGLPGRILISAMGLMVAMLSLTGVLIWLRKRQSRRMVAAQTRQPQAALLQS